MGNNQSKSVAIVSIQKMVSGLLKHFPNQSLVLNGTTTPVVDVAKQLDDYVALVAAVAAAQTTWKQQNKVAEQTSTTEVTPLMRSLRRYVQAAFGATSATVEDFGMTPVKIGVKSAEEKAAAVEKALATRVARRTMGKRQKAKVHGVVSEPGNPSGPSSPPNSPAGTSPAVATGGDAQKPRS